MNASIDWINSYLDRPADAAEAERVLTAIGFPLDGVEPIDGEPPDTRIDVEVTSNRPDVLCHLGVARELAAATGRTLRPPAFDPPRAAGGPINSLTSVDNAAPDLCPTYTARVITGVKIAPSPGWLRRRVESIGLRAINNVVDVTNFVLHELGQPLHAFDLAKLDGRRIVVRRAAAGERFTAIDGSKHKLTANMLVIADGSKPQAIAGVMGGADSEVTDATTDVLLESAMFDPLNVRSTSRSLKLASDSSYRFERGVDPAGVDRASRRAAQLIVELAGGKLAEGVIVAGSVAAEPRRVSMRPARCNALLGTDLPAERIIELLAALGLQPTASDGAIACTIPTHRLDLHREVDLIEEVARLHGFDHIAVNEKITITARRPQRRVEARKLLGRVLVAHGYCETITFSNVPDAWAKPFAGGAGGAGGAGSVDLVHVDAEKKKADPALRPSVLPSLLACRKANQDAGNRDVRLFETAQTFGRRDGKYVERRTLAMLADAPDAAAAMRQMRGTIEELAAMLGADVSIIAADPAPEWADVAAAVVDAGDRTKRIGVYGRASAAAAALFDLQSPVVLAELDYESLLAHYPPTPHVAALPRYPAIERDLSVSVPESTAWEAIEREVRAAEPALLDGVSFVGVYRGKQVGAGRKSVTLRMTFRHDERTLQHDEVTAQVDAVVARLSGNLNAELRAG